MKDHTDNKNSGAEGSRSGKQGSFKKKNNKYKKSEPNTAGEFFKGIAFSLGLHGPELYLKMKE